MITISMLFMCVMAVAIILLVLVQRGKGGGLAGAFGGLGGQSALGTKAGDMMMKITVGAAILWLFACVITIWALKGADNVLNVGDGNTPAATATDGDSSTATLPAEADDAAATDPAPADPSN